MRRVQKLFLSRMQVHDIGLPATSYPYSQAHNSV